MGVARPLPPRLLLRLPLRLPPEVGFRSSRSLSSGSSSCHHAFRCNAASTLAVSFLLNWSIADRT